MAIPGCIDYCPRCGVKLNVATYYSKWMDHFFDCMVAVRTNTRGGGFACICDLRFRSHRLFSDHIRRGVHDWEKLAVRRAMESM